MHIFKRGWVSVKRRPLKSLTLFLIIFILGNMAAGAISVSLATTATETNLRRRIPAIATIIQDHDALEHYLATYGDWPEAEGWDLTPALIETIGNLPYVRAFDYTVRNGAFFSRELVLPTDPNPYLGLNILEEVILERLHGFSLGVKGLEQFVLHGVYHRFLLDLEEGTIELVEGRIFTEDEMSQPAYVALVSQAFAEANQLLVGRSLVLERNLYHQAEPTGIFTPEDYYQDKNLYLSEVIEFEIIGIFTPTFDLSPDTRMAADVYMDNHMELNTRIYVPIEITKATTYFHLNYLRERYPDQVEEFSGFWLENVLFALDDPLYLERFSEAATKLIPDFWLMNDLTSAFSLISDSLEIMGQIALWIVLGAVGSALIVLGLLLMLFLRARKVELGIYLALGETRKNVAIQVLLEIVTISAVALAIALFTGYLFANQLSWSMLRNDLIDNPPVLEGLAIGGLNDFNQMGFGLEMTAAEMLDAYSVSLDTQTVLLFYSMSLGMVILGTILPTIYMMRLNPKKILM